MRQGRREVKNYKYMEDGKERNTWGLKKKKGKRYRICTMHMEDDS
jgi:hypothetical protein